MPTEIDIWDYKMILLFKSNKASVAEMKKLWAERCNLEVEYCHLEYINAHFLSLAERLSLFNEYTTESFIMSLDPELNWRYEMAKDAGHYYPLILLSRLVSLYTNTEIIKLPGWERYHQNTKI